MSGPAVAHLTTAVAVAGGGMLAGHLIAPAAAGAGPARLLLFVLVMLALGAWRGRAEWRARAEWVGRAASAAQERVALAAGALAALVAAAAGYGIVHG